VLILATLYLEFYFISIIRNICAGHKVHKGDEKCIQNLIGKPEGNRLLRRHRHIWENNIKMDLTEIGCEDVNWIHLGLGVFTVMKIQVVVFWVLMPHSNMVGYQHFRGPCCLQLQGEVDIDTDRGYKMGRGTPFSSPCRWRQHSPSTYWYPTASLYSITTQKTVTS
jgi:hypothetical protein